MSSFFNKLFRQSKKSTKNDFPSQTDYDRRRSGPARHETFSSSHLKSSMRRRLSPPLYGEEFLTNPTAAYHHDPQPSKRRGPMSLPGRPADDLSPSSSNEGGAHERSYRSEFVPTARDHRHSRRDAYGSRSRKGRTYYADEFDDSDSESQYYKECEQAVKQIKKLKTSLLHSVETTRRLEADKTLLERENRDLKKSNRHAVQEVAVLRSETLRLNQQILMLQNEVAYYRSQFSQMPMQRYGFPMQPSYGCYTPQGMTNMNNTAPGVSPMIGSGGFRPPQVIMNSGLGEGSGETLAFMSATTVASTSKLPGMTTSEDIQDEVKVFRKPDETSPSRPPTDQRDSAPSLDITPESIKTDD